MSNTFLGVCKLCNKEKQLEKYKGMWICSDCLAEIKSKNKINPDLANSDLNVETDLHKKEQTHNSEKSKTSKEKIRKKVYAITQKQETRNEHNTSTQQSWFKRILNFLVDVYYILFPVVIIGACACFYYDWANWFTILATVFLYFTIPVIVEDIGGFIIYLLTTSEGHRFIIFILWLAMPILIPIVAFIAYYHHLISAKWTWITILSLEVLYVMIRYYIIGDIKSDDDFYEDYTHQISEDVSDYELEQAYDRISSEMSQLQYRMDELPFNGSGSYCGSKNYYSLDEDEKHQVECMRSEYEKLYKQYQRLEEDLQKIQETRNNRRFNLEVESQEKTRETVNRSNQDIETSKYNRR